MANKSSAEKRNRQNKKTNERNRQARSALRGKIKEVVTAASAKDKKASENLKSTVSAIAKAASKKLVHKKNAARKISRLTKKVNAASK